MAWASNYAVPASPALKLNLDIADAICAYESNLIQPKIAAGTDFDCSACTALSLRIDNGKQPGDPLYMSTAVTTTQSSPGATGVTMLNSGPNLLSALNTVNASSASGVYAPRGGYSVHGTDGTTILLLAQGTYTLNVSP